jgi:hypothetical protein
MSRTYLFFTTLILGVYFYTAYSGIYFPDMFTTSSWTRSGHSQFQHK